MLKRALVCLLLLAGAARAAEGPVYTKLPPGRYSLVLHGMICTVSARAIAAQWTKLPEVDKVDVDFDKSTAVISVRLASTLRVSSLVKGLRRAAKIANLGERYELSDILYVP
jgi:copper chaperone CopZ